MKSKETLLRDALGNRKNKRGNRTEDEKCWLWHTWRIRNAIEFDSFSLSGTFVSHFTMSAVLPSWLFQCCGIRIKVA